MNSINTSIYEYEEVLYTLAWLSRNNFHDSPKKIVRLAARIGLIYIYNKRNWKANEKAIFRRLKNPKVKFPHHRNIENITKILIGLGEMSARSHGDFIGITQKKFTTYFYKNALPKVMRYTLTKHEIFRRRRTLEEIAYSQKIGKTEFNWNSFIDVSNDINYAPRISTYNYGLFFIVNICLRVTPLQFSIIFDEFKNQSIAGYLCHPVIEPLIFGEKTHIVSLLKSKNTYLKLLACASIMNCESHNNKSTIDKNIKTLVANEVEVGDAIWQSSIKLNDYYHSVERIKDQIESSRHEIMQCERDPTRCPKGIDPNNWIKSRKATIENNKKLLSEYQVRLNIGVNEIRTNWPRAGINKQQTDNLVNLIRNEQLSRELAETIPSQDNKIQILESAIYSINQWIGVSSKSNHKFSELNFCYSSKNDLKRLLNAANTLLLLSNIKNESIGKLLGKIVNNTVIRLENFSYAPYMHVRKPSQWQSSISRLACIHLLAMFVFKEIKKDKEHQIFEIVPTVVEKINFLLKIKDTPLRLSDNELFRDLKSITPHVISKKIYMSSAINEMIIDSELPPDYRARMIVLNKTLIVENRELLIELFKVFSKPPIYVDEEDMHFSEWINLLDFCIAYCWNFDAEESAFEIVQIWEAYCPFYSYRFSDFIDYARNLYWALSRDGRERVWLKELYSFEHSHCMKVLSDR